MECSKCGGIGRLFDVISGEGIVKICENCLSEENIPIIRKPTETQIQSVNKDESLYNRLARSRGLDAEEHKKNIFGSEQKKELKQQEVTLRDLVDKKFDRFVKEKKVSKRDDVIDNFHWIVMRARRNKKMTVTQLAKEIGESEKVVKMAEQGVLPEGDYRVARRLEIVLGINILKPEIAERLDRQRKQLGFDEMTAKTLTISDLQEMKKDSFTEAPKKIPYWKRVMSRLIKRENPTVEDEIKVFVDDDGDNIPRAPEQREVDANRHNHLHGEVVKKEEGEDLEFSDRGESSIEFDETSLEIDDVRISDKEIEEESQGKTSEELTQEEIDEIIYGKKK